MSPWILQFQRWHRTASLFAYFAADSPDVRRNADCHFQHMTNGRRSDKSSSKPQSH